MKKNIMFTVLTLLSICAIIVCVGCKSGNLFISVHNSVKSGENINKENNDFISSGNEKIMSGELIFSGEFENRK